MQHFVEQNDDGCSPVQRSKGLTKYRQYAASDQYTKWLKNN